VRRVPLLIVGGGPAGCAAAITLARGGLKPELIERTAEPHDIVCGGFLGWDALAALRGLGLDPVKLGARPIDRLRLVAKGRAIERRLPKLAAGLSRRCLDEAMLAAAEGHGALVRRGVAVRSAEDRSVRTDAGEEIEADALFLATGKHELRGLARPVATPKKELAVGLRTSFMPDARSRAELEGRIELHPFDGGYAGLLMQEDGGINLCLSVSSARLREAGGVEALMERLAAEAPLLGSRLQQVGETPWLSISNVPYGWRARGGTGGLYRLGDQAAVIASLAGDGIAIALTSGVAAAQAHLAGNGAAAYQVGFADRAARPLRVAQTLRWAAEHKLPRRLMFALARLAPGLAGTAARMTRIAS
jgi:flavin-dependent dehydrogenase